MKSLRIHGARTHNLKNINLDIPRDCFVILTGVSGSGKSSLAFDTLYAEGQRRYVESLSSYARQFLSMMDKPDVDRIEGLSPAISIEQKTTSHNPRSTVGTVTEIYDYLRVLFARAGVPYCPEHGLVLNQQSVEHLASTLMEQHNAKRIAIAAPLAMDKKGSHELLLSKMEQQGFSRVFWNGKIHTIEDLQDLDPKKHHDLDVIVDRLRLEKTELNRLIQSLQTALGLSDRLARIVVLEEDGAVETSFMLSSKHGCSMCGFSLPQLEPKMFSFNSPIGSCGACNGLGFEHQIDPERVVIPASTLSEGAIALFSKNDTYYFDLLKQICAHYHIDLDQPFRDMTETERELLLYGDKTHKKISIQSLYFPSSKPKKMIWEGVLSILQKRYAQTEQEAIRESLKPFIEYLPCKKCEGSRLKAAYRAVRVGDLSIERCCQVSIEQCYEILKELELSPHARQIAEPVLEEIQTRLSFLINVGLSYLSLDRAAETLSGGESQRIRLASQIGSRLVGVMYVLDEPSIGLHQRDNDKLIQTLRSLVDLGNTVIVVEHDEEAILAADHVIDLGPGAGVLGGHVLAQGTPEDIINNPLSVTGNYLSGRKVIHALCPRAASMGNYLTVHGASRHNLKNISARIPVGLLTCVTGVSGSGKSSLINHTVVPYLAAKLNRQIPSRALRLDSMEGVEHFDKQICIDQSPIGRTPRSNPATYTGLLSPIRDFFAQLPQSKALGFKPGQFSFNVAGGRCETCHGDGMLKVEMHFLSDVYVPCEVCHGRRYNAQTLEVRYKGYNIADVLDMTVDQAAEVFTAFPLISRKLATLQKVGLGYIKLGQNATTLSGGEAQRIKLSKELSKRDTGKTFYVLDEPTTGLHFEDIQKLIQILFELRDKGNTVCVIEHNLDVIHCADWIIDLGKDGGEGGGEIIFQGKFEDFMKSEESLTAYFLKRMQSDRAERWKKS
jgi:excinuclease ABC subunit A